MLDLICFAIQPFPHEPSNDSSPSFIPHFHLQIFHMLIVVTCLLNSEKSDLCCSNARNSLDTPVGKETIQLDDSNRSFLIMNRKQNESLQIATLIISMISVNFMFSLN